MKKSLALIILLLSVSRLGFAESNITENPNSGEKIGTVSVSGAYSLDDLTEKLSQKAESEGASSMKVISAGGQNKIFGVAEIYK